MKSEELQKIIEHFHYVKEQYDSDLYNTFGRLNLVGNVGEIIMGAEFDEFMKALENHANHLKRLEMWKVFLEENNDTEM